MASRGTLRASPKSSRSFIINPRSSRHIFQEPVVSLGDTVAERDRRLPAKITQLGDVEKFSRRAIGLGRVPREFAIKTDDVADQLSQIADRDVFAPSNINDFRGIIFL